MFADNPIGVFIFASITNRNFHNYHHYKFSLLSLKFPSGVRSINKYFDKQMKN